MLVEAQLRSFRACQKERLTCTNSVCEAKMKTRFQKIGLSLFFLLSLASLAAAAKVFSDFDPKANFSQYKTFTWIKRPHMEDPLMDDRIVNGINAELTSKGWTLVEDGADIGVAAHVATRKARDLETFYSGFGGGWGWHRWGVGTGIATTHVETYTVGTLVVDLFDSRTKQVIFRAWATDALPDNPKKETKKLDKDIEKMFKDFPPK
jgi:hypothetical protein